MTLEELKQPYEPEGVYAGMTQAEALRYLAKRYLRKPECVALCNEVANNLPKLLKVAEAAGNLRQKQRVYMAFKEYGDETDIATRDALGKSVADAAVRVDKALEELK